MCKYVIFWLHSLPYQYLYDNNTNMTSWGYQYLYDNNTNMSSWGYQYLYDNNTNMTSWGFQYLYDNNTNMTSWGFQYWHKRNRNLFPWGSNHVVYSALYRPRPGKRFLVMCLITFSNIPALFVTSLISRRLLAKKNKKQKNTRVVFVNSESLFLTNRDGMEWNGMEIVLSNRS